MQAFQNEIWIYSLANAFPIRISFVKKVWNTKIPSKNKILTLCLAIGWQRLTINVFICVQEWKIHLSDAFSVCPLLCLSVCWISIIFCFKRTPFVWQITNAMHLRCKQIHCSKMEINARLRLRFQSQKQ